MRTTRVLGAVLLAAAASCSDGGSAPEQTEGGVPTNIRAVVTGSTVKLSWDPVPGAKGYMIYMAEVGGVKRVNVSTLAGNMTHNHTTTDFDHPAGLLASLKYHFVITALKADDTESLESCEVTAKIASSENGAC